MAELRDDIGRIGQPTRGWRRPRHWWWHRARKPRPLPISLALQGGGSLGAFTWGVLDRLLEDDHISFDALSGASAGAVNAVALASGLAEGSRETAKAKLARVWQRLSKSASVLPATGHPMTLWLTSGASLLAASMAAHALDLSTKVMSPYQLNPLGINPLRDILVDEIDFDLLRDASPVRLLIAATRVKDGRARLFRGKEVSLDVVLASACLPHLHHAVSIDEEWYWDGGISANPPILHLAAGSQADDVVLVQLTPTEHDFLPRKSAEISKRLNQIAFSLPLQRELDLLAIATELHRRQGIFRSSLGRKLQRLKLHRIAAEDEVEDFHDTSGFNLDWSFLTALRDNGRAAAEVWLKTR